MARDPAMVEAAVAAIGLRANLVVHAADLASFVAAMRPHLVAIHAHAAGAPGSRILGVLR